MTTHQNNAVVWRCNNSTEFYSCILKFTQAFDAVGVVRTTDTGQVSLAGPTLALPATVDTQMRYAHFEVRKLERSGYPTIYIRIDYGARQPSATYAGNYVPCVKLTTGTATDGAGTLAGPARFQALYSADGYVGSSYTTPVSPRPLYMASDGQNYLTLTLDPSLIGPNPTTGTVPIAMAIERCISASTIDYDTDSYILFGHTQTTAAIDNQAGFTGTYMTIVNLDSLTFINGGNLPVQAPVGMTSSRLPGQTLLFPITVCTPKIKMPAKSCIYFFHADIPSGNQFSTSFYGQTKNYLAIGSTAYPNSAINGNAVGPALLFE